MIKNIIFILFITIFCSCVASPSNQEREKNMTDFKINKDICLGRMLITIPEDYIPRGEIYKFYWGQNIEQKKQTKEEFNHEINKIRDELKNVKKDGKKRSLYEDITLKNGDRILFSWETAFGYDIYGYKAYAWRKGITYLFQSDTLEEDIFRVKERLTHLLTNLRRRAFDEIPTEQGFCFDNGFIADDGKDYQYETASFSFGLKSHPDLDFEISTDPRTLEKQDSLLDRYNNAKVPAELVLLWSTEVKFLVREKDKTAYLDGEKVFSTLPATQKYEEGRYQDFDWQNLGVYQDVLRPGISVNFKSGDLGSKTSSISDKEAIDLFNQVMEKIRPRPINGKKLERW